MKVVAVLGSKGGTGKTTLAHLIALGAILRGEPAAYVLTDPTRKVRGEGRPYGVLDGRDPVQLAHIIESSRASLNGWLVIDGGGNRPAFDVEIATVADLPLIPFRASEEDLDTVAADLTALTSGIAWPNAWPTNRMAATAAQFYIEGLAAAFPDRVITDPVPFVNASADLLAMELRSAVTPVRSVARKVFDSLGQTFKTLNNRNTVTA